MNKEVDNPIQLSTPSPSKQFHLVLDRFSASWFKKKLEQHEKGYLAYKNLHLPNHTLALQDPRKYPHATMWRDSLRQQLKFETLKVNFLLISIPVQRIGIYSYTNADDNIP